MKALLLVFLFALTACGALFAQQDAASTKRSNHAAITLLFADDAVPPVALVRQRLGEILGKQVAKVAGASGPWLESRADGMAGAFDGCAFTVRFANKPLAVDAAAVRHLDNTEQDVVRKHGAHCLIVCEQPSMKQMCEPSYQVLGKVAAALLRKQAIAVALRAHGLFSLVHEETAEELVGDDVLAALEPTVATSLVVLLSKPRPFDEAIMEKKLAKELNVVFDDERNFVVGDGEMGVVKLGEQMVMVSSRGRAPFDLEELKDLRVRNAVKKHQAMLHLVEYGPVTDAAEAARRRRIARIAAGLWDDTCLAINWHCNFALLAFDGHLLRDLRSDDPVRATLRGRAPGVFAATDERAMAAAIEKARATFDQAVANLRAGGSPSAKFPFATRKGGQEHIWVSIEKVEDGVVHGRLANEPVDVEGLKIDSPVRCKLEELSDWLYVVDGEVFGGYTVKVLQAQAKAEQGK